MAAKKIAVVTGSNKGIGYAIVKGLCEKFDGIVYLTSRDSVRGEEAVKKLNHLGLNPLYYQLDVTNQDSIDKFRDHLLKEHGGIDILINNAGIYQESKSAPTGEEAAKTIDVNYFSVFRMCNTLFPILRKNARVINVSSSAGHICRIPSEEIRKKLSDPSLTIEELNKLMEQYVRDVKEGTYVEKGWPKVAYLVSKVGCCAISIIQQRNLDKEQPFRNISVNSVHPGYVKTDLTGGKGFLDIEEGAAAPLHLALEDHGLRGAFLWFDKSVMNWYEGNPPLF